MSPDKERSDAERYRRILETAPDAIVVVDPTGSIVYANAQTEKLFGHPCASLLGASVETLLVAAARGAHGGHVDRFFSRPAPRSMGSGMDLFGLRADGVEFPIEVSLSPLETDEGMLVSAAIRDISARKAMEAAARLHAERLAGAVESMKDAIAIYDNAGRVVLCNGIFKDLLGDALADPLIGRHYDEVLDAWLSTLAFADDAARSAFRARQLAERSAPKGTSDVRTREGRNLRMTSRRTADGGIVETVWDLTEDVRREEDLDHARAASDAGSAAKSEFLSSMSHELRTPLNAVLGFAQLLQRDRREPLSPRHQARVEQILRGGEHLLRLIDDILDLSGIEAGRVSISTEPVGVAEVLDEVCITLQSMARSQGVHVAVLPVVAGLPMVAVDRTRFAQILMNFGSNAVKYNHPGGSVMFAVSRLDDGRVRISVKDDGLGIPVAERDKIFQPFHRAGQETGPIQGTGIGLAISKRLAALMASEVGFTSEVGIGSTFWLDVPVHAQARPGPGEHDLADRAAVVTDRPSKLVLYVEDNPANVAFMVDLLDAFEGIELLVAKTAEAGIEMAIARRPAAILMDINLPGMSGLDALDVLRATPATARIPVVALTAAAAEKDREKGLAAGFFRYLTKPVKVDELMSALELILAGT